MIEPVICAVTCFLFVKNLFIFNWRTIALQYCVGFCHTSTWISHRYTYVPSLLNPVTCFLDSTVRPHICPHYVVILVDLAYSSNLLNSFSDTVICFFFPTHSPPLNIFPVFHRSHWWTYWLTPGLRERERERASEPWAPSFSLTH